MLEEFYASLLDGGDEDDGLPPTELTLAKLPGLPHVKIVINKNEGVHKEPHFHIVIKDVSEASIAIRDPWWLLRRSAGIPRARLSLADHVCRHDHARRRRRRLASVATVFARGGRLAAPPSRHSAAVGRQAEGDPTRPDRVGRARGLDADVEECAAHRPARDASSLASRRLQGPVALAEPTALRKAPPRRDRRVDSLDGVQQLDVGGGKNPRRIAQARDQSQQTHDPEVHTRSPAGQTAWAALVHVLAKPCPRSLGVRLSASLRRVLPCAFRPTRTSFWARGQRSGARGHVGAKRRSRPVGGYRRTGLGRSEATRGGHGLGASGVLAGSVVMPFFLRPDSPLSEMAWALCTSRSQMASATSGSPRASCQTFVASCVVTTVDV